MNAAENVQEQAVVGAFPQISFKKPAGDHWVWLCSGALTVSLLALIGLVLLIISQGFRALWPAPIHLIQMGDKDAVLGEIVERDPEHDRIHIRRGNREIFGLDFTWVNMDESTGREIPKNALMLERLENGNFYGFLDNSLSEDQFKRAVAQGAKGLASLHHMEDALNDYNIKLKKLKSKMFRAADNPDKLAALAAEKTEIEADFQKEIDRVEKFRADLFAEKVALVDVTGRAVSLPAASVLRIVYPNRMNFFSRCWLFVKRFFALLVDPPREANTEGGLFPAIFGTALMVLLMSLFATPLGVIAAVYLHEYAKSGWFVRWVRITVNNLAGVPSIVYGIFGLQFFVYGIGGSIDQWFFSENLPTPTFGTGGLIWASLTMALLTLPVVIVATEEGLSAVPKGMREGALALGASQWQTIWRVVLPMSSPGILTGVILSIARAAGEVAPLMLVGVIKLAPHLALDGHFPFFHPERKFMHLGFHIYDVGFQSPNVDAAIPMVYVTTFFLLTLVLGLNALAMILRQKLRQRYRSGAF
ncbi:MAG: phosphate ABC transporter permease PstA [Acidobacteria bacterium]|nr:phosphate ABC transporter permease PstA [Acidobacteriota bacterium]MCB9399103.1 phosphate ABC transporter permease PstA [Acidobacteriota bacterium]